MTLTTELFAEWCDRNHGVSLAYEAAVEAYILAGMQLRGAAVEAAGAAFGRLAKEVEITTGEPLPDDLRNELRDMVQFSSVLRIEKRARAAAN